MNKARFTVFLVVKNLTPEIIQEKLSSIKHWKQITQDYPVALIVDKEHSYKKYYQFGVSQKAKKEMLIKQSKPVNALADVLSESQKKQLRIGSQVGLQQLGYFFNGQNDSLHENEEWKEYHCSTLRESNIQQYFTFVCTTLEESIKRGGYDFIAAEYFSCLPEVSEKMYKTFAKKLHDLIHIVEELHGNICLVSDNEGVSPCLFIDYRYRGMSLVPGQDAVSGDFSVLSPIGTSLDIAPTLLSMLGMESSGMKGKSLVKHL